MARWSITHVVVMLPLRQEPEKGPVSAAGVHAHVVGAVAGSGAVDESSDSEAEQEGPQKLIRKVSTSGQIRSKVRHNVTHVQVTFCVLGKRKVLKQVGQNVKLGQGRGPDVIEPFYMHLNKLCINLNMEQAKALYPTTTISGFDG